MWVLTTDAVVVLLAACAASDVAQRHIPNSLVVAVAVAGLALSSQLGMLGLGRAVAGSTVAGLVGIMAWRAGLIGGGDAKLLIACASAVGLGRLPSFFAAVALAGGSLALTQWLVQAVARSTWRSKQSPATTTPVVGMPYGVAIGVGTVATMLR